MSIEKDKTIEIIKELSSDKDFKKLCYAALEKLKVKSIHWD